MTAGAKQSRKREEAIAALLTHPTIAEAAQVAGIGEKTLRRWLRDPPFTADYRRAREEGLRGTLTRLQSLMGKALTTLERAMDCGTVGTEVRAALGVFEQALRATETLDLVERVNAIEKAVNPEDSAV